MPEETAPTPIAETPIPKAKSKKNLVVIIVVVLVLLGLAGGIFYYNSSIKSSVKEKAASQSSKLNDVENEYNKIIDLVNGTSNGETKLKISSNIDKSWPKNTNKSTAVLGTEDTAAVQASRQLIEEYRKVKKDVDEIGQQNKDIDSATSNPLALMIPKNKDLIGKTKTFVTDTANVMDYLGQMEQIGIDSYTVGTALGQAILVSIQTGATDSSVTAVENKIRELDDLIKKQASIDTSNLPKELKEQHSKSLTEAYKVKDIFTPIVQALKAKDGVALQAALVNLSTSGTAISDSSQVSTINFWQNNPTIRSVSGLITDWDNYAKKF